MFKIKLTNEQLELLTSILNDHIEVIKVSIKPGDNKHVVSDAKEEMNDIEELLQDIANQTSPKKYREHEKA